MSTPERTYAKRKGSKLGSATGVDGKQRRRGHATLADVAAIAGVVPMTVSRALNDSGYVSAAVRRRVQEAADALQYRPNMMARRLAGSRLHAVGILLPDIANPFFAEIVNGLMSVIRPRDYTSFIAMAGSNESEQIAAIRSFIDHRVDGMVVATRNTQLQDATLKKISAQGVPVVVIGRPVALPGIDSVSADHFQGAFDATSHLLALGHRRIAFLGASGKEHPRLRRYEGYLAALANAGITAPAHYSIAAAAAGSAYSTEQDGYSGLIQLRKLKTPPTAVFARNDYTAIGALRAAHTLGLSVPNDVAIAGFDNVSLAAYQTPPLTTVEQPIAEQGRIAAELLLKRIESSSRRQRHTVQLPCKLIVRDSTARTLRI